MRQKIKLDKQGNIVLSETTIKKQIKGYLKLKGVFYWWNLQGLGCYPGLPDLAGLLDNGRPFFVEVKTDKGKLSKHQYDYLAECNKRKALGICVHSFEEFQNWFENL